MNPYKGEGGRIFEAVAIAALSTAFTEFITWGVKELRKKYGTVEEEEEEETTEEEEENLEEAAA